MDVWSRPLSAERLSEPGRIGPLRSTEPKAAPSLYLDRSTFQLNGPGVGERALEPGRVQTPDGGVF